MAKRWLARRELIALDGELARVARSAVSDRLALGEALDGLGERFRELGFRTFGMYVRERLSLGPRWCADTRVLARRLSERPALRSALLSGRIGWSLAELLARASTPEDEAELLEACASMTVRQVRAALRDRVNEEAPPKVEAMEVGLTATERLALRATQLGVEHMDGGASEVGQWLEHALAEAQVFLLARGVDVDEVVEEALVREELEEPPPPETTREELEAPTPIAEGEPAELDAQARSRAARLASREARLGELLLRFLGARGWRRLGYASEQQYCDERLGMCRATARKRVRLARHDGWLDGLTAAVHAGRLGIESAHLVAGVASPDTLQQWIERAEARTFKHLREEVRAVELAAELSGVPVGEYDPPSDEELAVVEAFEREVISGASVARAVSGAMRAVQMSGGGGVQSGGGGVQMSGGGGGLGDDDAAAQRTGGDAQMSGGLSGDDSAVRAAGDEAVQMSGDDMSLRAAGDEAVQMSGDDMSLHAAGDDNAVRAAGDDEAVQMSGDDMSLRAAGDDNAVRVASDEAVQMSGDDNAVRAASYQAVQMSGDDEAVQMSGDDMSLRAAGDDNAVRAAGDEAVQMSGDDMSVPEAGDDNAVRAAGDEAVQMSGGDEAVQMSGDDMSLRAAGDDNAVRAAGDEAVQMSGDDMSVPEAGDDNAVRAAGDEAVQMSGGDEAVQMSGTLPMNGPTARRRLTRLRARSDVIAHYRVLERAFEGAGIPMSFPMFLATAFWMSWSEAFFVGNRWKALHDRDRHRCVSPVCESRSLTNHHVRYRAHGGGDELDNQITLCEFCHLEGEHGGRLKVRGSAGALRWEFGRRPILRVEGRRKVA